MSTPAERLDMARKQARKDFERAIANVGEAFSMYARLWEDYQAPGPRSPRQALTEFKVACELCFGCMDPETRVRAVLHARDATKTVPFRPNCEPT